MSKAKILVIDDEPDFLELVKIRLEANDYQVKIVSTAKDVLADVHTFKPDLILLDLLMPGIGGIEAVEMLDKDPIGMNIPIIIVSAITKAEDKTKAYLEGIVDYLEKPVEPKELLEKIEHALRQKQS